MLWYVLFLFLQTVSNSYAYWYIWFSLHLTSMGMILPEYVCFVGSICLLINGNVIENDGKTNDEITATLIMVDWALWNVLYLYETDSW